MSEKIDVSLLSPLHHQALACMFYAKLPKEDSRYSGRIKCFSVFESVFGKKVSTYKNNKDTYDAYFDTNKRIGWKGHTILSCGKEYQEVYDNYKDYDVDVLEQAVTDIVTLYSKPKYNYVALRLTNPDSVHSILQGGKDLTVDGVTDLQDDLSLNRIVFISLGGDKAKPEVDWDTGFYAIASVSKAPYDIGYEKNKKGQKYFKFDIHIVFTLDKPLPRDAFIHYPKTYDAPFPSV